MAQTVNLRLSRTDNTPWGFRLQGGKDFGQPLLIQKVNGGSLAERAGLIVGDSLIRVNNVEVADLRHKEAQDVIVRAGNNIDVTVQRGGSSTWKPQVSPVGVVPQPGKASPAATVTKTSLAAGRSPGPAIGSGHNISPKPFPTGPQVNGDPSVKAIVNKQYNTPVQMYSEQTIAETLSAQAEVLAGGAIGVNFMKNEKTYDSQKSEVFKMVQEVDKEPREPEQPDLGTPAGSGSGLRHVLPPEPKPAPASPQPQQLPPGQNICADCERLIVGVFVRIKDKNLHVECFKCATCGTSLKNVGYYNINNKLYCDIHAKMVARQNPPAPNVDPITVAPGARIPVGAFTAPQAAAAPQSPQPGTLAPLPFHVPRTTTSHVAAPWYGGYRQTNAPSGPKPFGSVSAPSAPSTISFPPSVISPPSAPAPTIPQPPPPSSFSKPLPGLSSSKPNPNLSRGAGGAGGKTGTLAGSTAPKRGRGILNPSVAPGARIPLCGHCNTQIRGPFITALGKIWCPEHFVCVNAKCRRPLQDIGFVEEQDGLYCEFCFEQYLAPTCDKCHSKIKGDCLNAIGKHFHPECFSCAYCGKLFGNNPFFLEDTLPYCENDWNELFTTKCFSCGFPIEAGDRWVEALNNNYHSQCFNCTMCKKNLEGQTFFAKAGRPFCRNHVR